MKSRILSVLLLAALPAVLSACGVSQPFPDRRFYVIDSGPAPAATAPAERDVSLRVANVRVTPPFDAVPFNYKVAPNEFKSDYYHAFAASPSRLLTAQLVAWLNSSGSVKFAVGAEMPVIATYTLEATVTDLYGDYSAKGAPKAVISTRVLVIDNVGGGTRIILNKNYAAAEPIAGDGPDKLVAAWNSGWHRMLQEIAADAAKLPAPPVRGN